MTPIIYHNPSCGTSRNVLAMIRNAGVEPVIIEYLKTPPDRQTLVELVRHAGLTVRQAIRTKAPVYAELELDDERLTDEHLLDAMLEHPVLMNRPFVVTVNGARLCRPSEVLLEILPEARSTPFTKEDGDVVVDAQGNRLC